MKRKPYSNSITNNNLTKYLLNSETLKLSSVNFFVKPSTLNLSIFAKNKHKSNNFQAFQMYLHVFLIMIMVFKITRKILKIKDRIICE